MLLGNLPLHCFDCSVCGEECGEGVGLRDFSCAWCGATVHKCCKAHMVQVCTAVIPLFPVCIIFSVLFILFFYVSFFRYLKNAVQVCTVAFLCCIPQECWSVRSEQTEEQCNDDSIDLRILVHAFFGIPTEIPIMIWRTIVPRG